MISHTFHTCKNQFHEIRTIVTTVEMYSILVVGQLWVLFKLDGIYSESVI